MSKLPSTRSLRALALAAVSAAARVPAVGHASAFYIQEQSVRGLGRAYAGEAADTGASALWFNPAAIARSGREIYFGANLIGVDDDVYNRGSTITYPGGATVGTGAGGDHLSGTVLNGIVPNGAFVLPIGDRFTVGVSTAAPFNFTNKYGSGDFTRYSNIKSRLNTADIQFTGAMRVTGWLDLGVGLDTEYTSAKLTNAMPNLSPLLPDADQSLKGSGWNVGYTVGAQAHWGRWSGGVSYRSAMDHDLDGKVSVSGLLGPLAAANFTSGGDAHFTTPWFVTLAARYALTDRLTLDGQVQRQGWSEFDNLTINYTGGTEVAAEGYKDTTTASVGADYKVSRKLTVRAGVGYDPTPTVSTRDLRVPDGNRWLYTVGATYDVRPNMTVDAALGYVDIQRSGVNNTVVFYEGTGADTVVNNRASVEGESLILSAGLHYRF